VDTARQLMVIICLVANTNARWADPSSWNLGSTGHEKSDAAMSWFDPGWRFYDPRKLKTQHI